MRIPNLDRCGTLYKNAPEQGVGGAPRDQLVPVIENLWVAKVTISARTIATGARDANQVNGVFICRWFPDFDSQDGYWFEIDGKRLRVVRVDELDRRQAWQFYTEVVV